MCVVAIALDHDRRFPLVVAANRDEFFDRAAARLAWWTPPGSNEEVLAGRDMKGGGSWLGITHTGRLALLTNIRDPLGAADALAPSRGQIVPLWLTSPRSADQRWTQIALSGYSPFNLIAADFRIGECFWASSQRTMPVRLSRGLYGLSNAGLDAPWPKVARLKQRVSDALQAHDRIDPLIAALFAALADREPARDDELAFTALGLPFERALSSVFVRTPDGRYGTRCSTLVITERVGRHLVTHVLERTFPSGPGLALLRHVTLRDWPARERGAGAGLLAKNESQVQQSDAMRQRLNTAREPALSDTSPGRPAR